MQFMNNIPNTANLNFCPKSVAELISAKHCFVIPSYQRGYRWEEKQVIDLLEDIKEFTKRATEDSYYLQPLVVKPCKWKTDTNVEIGAWEVLDGQQRLTTLRLILMYLFENSFTRSEMRTFSEDMIYDIVYTNRPLLDFSAPRPQDNIDSYYLYTAKAAINKWFEEYAHDDIEASFKHCLIYPNKPAQVKFIWYVIPQERQAIESIQVFNRLNKGKISLTSSELIKALFIMDRNIVSGYDRLQADKLALDWTQIERQYQDDRFWYFICNNNDCYQTRIDILFDFVTEKPEDNTDGDYSYRLFQNLYDYCRAGERNDDSIRLHPVWAEHGIDNMLLAWEYVIKTNDRLMAWFENNLYYHYVGYLVSVGNQPLDIYRRLSAAKQQVKDREWTHDDTEREFHKQIMESFKDRDKYLNKDSIDGLEYGSKFVFRLLLLFNVETYRRKGLRFAFDSFKKEKWDIEHIDSQNNASLVEHDDRLRWLKNVAFILGIEAKFTERRSSALALYEECEALIPRYEANLRGTGIDRQYTDFCKKAIDYFSAEEGAIKNKDSIGNLTLLDYKTNREYQDAPFPYKRYCIVREDKACDRFMPLCTRNVFLKYYTNSNTTSTFIDAMRWSRPDFDGYMKEIHNTVDTIFDVIGNSNSIVTDELQ